MPWRETTAARTNASLKSPAGNARLARTFVFRDQRIHCIREEAFAIARDAARRESDSVRPLWRSKTTNKPLQPSGGSGVSPFDTSSPAAASTEPFVPRIGFRRTRWLFELWRCRSLIEAVRGYLRTNGSNCYNREIRVRVRVPRCCVRIREEARTMHWTEVRDRAFLTCVKFPPRTRSMRVGRPWTHRTKQLPNPNFDRVITCLSS
jgi:hypothetical protein